MLKKGNKSNLTYLAVNFIMLILSIAVLYPFLYCIAFSLSDSYAVMIRNVTIFPIGLTFENYKNVFQQRNIFNALLISILRTTIGIIWTLTITGLASYALSKRRLPGNRTISVFLIVPMYISGGLMPFYVLMHYLHLINSFWVYILPHGFWAFNMLLMRTYFDTIPPSLEESAKLDGAGELKIFIRIMIPLSMPIIAVIAMFTGVWHWNSWFDALLYVSKQDLKPLQALLQQMIMESFSSIIQVAKSGGRSAQKQASPEAIRMAALVFTTLPIVIIYPFFQKYFVRGIMIGAVKA